MIGKAKIGGSFGGCVSYCLNEKKKPEILGSNCIFGKDKNYIIHQFDMIRNQRPNLKKGVWHSSISFAHQDKVNNDLMLKVAKDYLKEMGLSDNQYLMVKHNDTQHAHLHIIINRVGLDGKVARDWKSGFRTKKVMQQLEKKYKLVQAESQANKRMVAIKEQIALGLSKKESLTQIFKRVEKLGYEIVYNKSSAGHVRGVGFKNKAKGIYYKSSSIGRKYSYSRLLKATSKLVAQFKSKQISR